MRKRKIKSADVTNVVLKPSVCVLKDHGQQPMKMRTEVTLLYNMHLSLFLSSDWLISCHIIIPLM